MDLNGVRYELSSPRDHVESYFLKANEPDGGLTLLGERT